MRSPRRRGRAGPARSTRGKAPRSAAVTAGILILLLAPGTLAAPAALAAPATAGTDVYVSNQ
jgi:hypothetical protein